jgi:chromosome segregation ATPase
MARKLKTLTDTLRDVGDTWREGVLPNTYTAEQNSRIAAVQAQQLLEMQAEEAGQYRERLAEEADDLRGQIETLKERVEELEDALRDVMSAAQRVA